MNNSSNFSGSPSISESQPYFTEGCSGISLEQSLCDVNNSDQLIDTELNREIHPRYTHKIIQKYGSSIDDILAQIKLSYSNKFKLSTEFNQFYK